MFNLATKTIQRVGFYGFLVLGISQKDEAASLLEESSDDSDIEENTTCDETDCIQLSSRINNDCLSSIPSHVFVSQSSLSSPGRHAKKSKHRPVLTRYLSSPGILSKAFRFDSSLKYWAKKCGVTRSLERQPTAAVKVDNHRRHLHYVHHHHHHHHQLRHQKHFPRLLFRNATDVAFTVPQLYVRTLLPGSKVGASKLISTKVDSTKDDDTMTKGNLSNLPNGRPVQDSAFSQAVAFRDESPFGQNIELSTLKFADESPSVDENLTEWLMSSGQSTTPSTSGLAQNPPPFDVSVSLTDGPSSVDSEKSTQNNCFSSLNSGLDNSGAISNCNSAFYDEPNTSDNTSHHHVPIHPISANVEHSHHMDDIEIMEDDDDNASLASAAYGQNPQYYQHLSHQTPPMQDGCNMGIAGGGGGGGWDQTNPVMCVAGDRRLPDVVAIDECYRESEEDECSTICLIANIDSLKKDQGVISIDPPQVAAPKRGAHQDRKDRSSLRRGVMMRQMSINPDVHPEGNAEKSTSASDPAQFQDINKTHDTAANNNNNNNNYNNNLGTGKGQSRKCSFSRNIVPPTVVVEEETGYGGELYNKDTDMDKRGNPMPRQNSSSGRPKMKHLSQNSSSPSAMRFRLTFDESADAAANTVIGLPDEVSPQIAVVGKRPSCICGEPELPREYLPESESNGLLRNDQCPLISRAVSPSPITVSTQIIAPPPPPLIIDSRIGGSPQIHSNESAFSTTIPSSCQNELGAAASVDALDAASHCDDPNFHSESVVNNNTSTSSTFIQSPPDLHSSMCHPRITIKISNSQQSFTPLLSDSPIPGMDGSYDICDNHSHHLYNDKDAISCRESSISPYPDIQYSHHPHHSYSSFTNEHSGIPSEATQLLADEFQHGQQINTVQAPPIQDLYRYHVFFSHCPEDRDWVEHMVAHLESPPFNYTCAYTSIQDEVDQGTLQQRLLCAAMLSERVVLVLSNKYVQETWFSFEKTLKQLTQMSLHNQRIMGVLLEDCVIPDSLGELYFLDACDPDFFHVFTKRLKTSRIPRSSASVSSDLGQNALAPTNVTNGKVLTFCRLQIKVGWDSYLVPPGDQEMDIPRSLTSHGIGMEKAEFGEIVTKVSGIVEGSNKLPWLLSARPMVALLLAGGLWIPAFIAVLVIHVDDDSGIALPIRLGVFLYPLGLVAAGYLIKWRRAYWLTKIVRLLVQNCIDVNQALYFQGRPLFTTAAHVRANIFAIYFVYFDATDCVRSVDLLLITCMEDDWDKLLRLISFYTRDENYLSRMSVSERLTVMMSAPYLVKLVRQVLPHPPQQRHVSRLLCLCQFTEECISRFAHGFDREDVPGLAELFTRHLPGKVSGSAVRRVQEELFHANHGLVP